MQQCNVVTPIESCLNFTFGCGVKLMRTKNQRTHLRNGEIERGTRRRRRRQEAIFRQSVKRDQHLEGPAWGSCSQGRGNWARPRLSLPFK